MDRTVIEQHWRTLSDEGISGMADWRAAHPRATLTEIELEIDQRLDRLRARMVEDTALASRQTEWRAGQAEAPRCPDCDQPLQSAGKRRRRVQTRGQQELTLARQYGVCPACGRGSFPPG
jgi:ribosomal protein L34E